MRSVSIVLLLAVVAVMAAAAPPPPEKEHYDLEQAPQLFEKYIRDYNKNYKDDADKEAHYKAFVNSLKEINRLNQQSTSAYFGINEFSDYTEEENKNMFGLDIE